MTVYLARDLIPGNPAPMGDERIQSRWFTSRELDDWVRRGKIQDGKTIAAFLMWRRERKR